MAHVKIQFYVIHHLSKVVIFPKKHVHILGAISSVRDVELELSSSKYKDKQTCFIDPKFMAILSITYKDCTAVLSLWHKFASINIFWSSL